MKLIWAVVFALVGAGCASDDDARLGQPDAADTPGNNVLRDVAGGHDGGTTDTTEADTSEPGLDVGDDDVSDPGPDVDLPENGSIETAPAVIEVEGSGGFLLKGTVLAPAGPIDPGQVLVVADRIVCVARDCTNHPAAAGVTVIDTRGVISPGLVDSHNHLTYNFLPEWEPGRFFDSRDAWSNNPDYERHVAPFADGRNRNERICPAAKWGEIRSILYGTTTVQGQSFNRSCLNRLVRNADHFHGLGYDHMGTDIASPADISTADAIQLAQRFSETSQPTTRYAVHMCEGLRGSNMAIEFESYAGRDPRTRLARHQGLSLLAYDGPFVDPATNTPYDFFFRGVAVLIHSLILDDAQIREVFETDSFVVWSPSSNLALYGETAPIEKMLQLQLTIGLGPDWTPSGEDEMLSEMRVARSYGEMEGIEALDDRRIWRMATSDGAEVLGLGDIVGQLEVDYKADIAVFGRAARDPYRAVLDSGAADVRLVLIDGLVYAGDEDLDGVALNRQCDAIDACGTPKFMCVRNTPGHADRADENIDDIRAQLIAILDGYGRAAELQELITCP